MLIIKDGAPRGAHAAQARALRERDHNFSSFVVSTFYRFKTVPSGAKYIFEIASNKVNCWNCFL